MKRRRLGLPLASIVFVTAVAQPARADLFGGDVVVLTQILIQSIETVIQLKTLLETGEDTLSLLRDVNSGVASGLDLIRITNPRFNPGVYGNLNDAASVLRAVQDVYGAVPKGADESLMASQDQSVAETIAMNRTLYDYADSVDRERDRIIYHAGVVSPQGAGKLQGQALGVLIGVTTQILRVQSQVLKLTAQNMAMQNRREKISSESFQQNYQGISNGLKELPTNTDLPRIGGDR
jgi:hypothetical protein